MQTVKKVSFLRRFISGALSLAVLSGHPAWAQTSEAPGLLSYEQGQSLLRVGSYRQAESALYEALQNSRANNGFYNAEQLPILESILATAVLRQKWDDFRRRADYYELLLYQLYGGSSVPLQEGLFRLAEWHLAAAGAMDSDHTVYHLIQSRTLLWRVVSMIEATGGRHDPRLPPVLYQIVLNHFYLASSTQRRRITSYELRSDSPTFISGWSQRGSATQRRHYETGVELLKRIGDIYLQTDGQESAKSMLQLHVADWHLLFGRTGEAFAAYRAATRSLAASGLTQAEIDSLLAVPRPLPLHTLQIQVEAASQPAGQYYIYHPWSRTMPGVGLPGSAPFSLLGEAGRGGMERVPLVIAVELDAVAEPVNIRVISEADGESGGGMVEYALSEMATVQFRPALQDGEAVPAEVTLQFMAF